MSASFDSSAFAHYLDRNCHELRAKWRELSKEDVFKPIFNMGINEQKELAYTRLRRLATFRLFSASDFFNDPLRVFANHEMAGYVDGSFATKLTV
jgi:acyl-CoA oxidase